jgi:hypothetical protein
MSGTPDWREIANVKTLYKKLAEKLTEEAILQVAYEILTNKDYLKQYEETQQFPPNEYEFDTLRIYLIAYLMRKYVK